jgi:hypothetical protein
MCFRCGEINQDDRCWRCGAGGHHQQVL